MAPRGQPEVHQQARRIGSAKVQADVSWARRSGAVGAGAAVGAGVVSWVETTAFVVDVAECP